MDPPAPDAPSGDSDSRKSLPQQTQSNDYDTLDHGTNTPHENSSAGKPQPAQQPVAVGSLLGKYELTEILGRGGMGIVYKAHDTVIERDVAIKILPSELSHKPRSLQRFLGEAKAAGRLDHPNSVRIYDVDEQNGLQFIVMELVEGGNIGDIFKQHGALRVIDATRVLVDACRGIAAAHSVGLVHRDIKPSNLLISDKNSVKVADFGVAKREDASTMQLTGEGNLIGTPYFMSPEQCSSEPADARSDVYSLGATYYALLTGQYPYHDAQTTMQVMYSHCHADPPNPRTVNPALPHACTAIVNKAMTKSPADRYQTAAQMLSDLEKLTRQLTGADLQQENESVSRLSAVTTSTPVATGSRKAKTTTKRNTPVSSHSPGGGCFSATLLLLLLVAGGIWAVTRFGLVDISTLFPAFASTYSQPTATVNVLCSPENQHWLQSAADAFHQTPAGRTIHAKLKVSTWRQAIRHIDDGNEETHVWCPSSSTFRDLLQRKLSNSDPPSVPTQRNIAGVDLAKSPMVFCIWKDRYDKFIDGYEQLDWDKIRLAMTNANIWGAIAAKNDWGPFKFGFADPLQDDSGAIVLCLMAYHHLDRNQDITEEMVSDPEFQSWFRELVTPIVSQGSPLPPHNEALLDAVLEHGPTLYDGFMVSESVLTRYLHSTESRWLKLQVVYPSRNMWHTNPYFELAPSHANAVTKFQEFLTSVPMQEEALRMGFRPINFDVHVPIHQRPIDKYRSYGFQSDISQVCQPPSIEVVRQLLDLYLDVRGPKPTTPANSETDPS